MLLLPWPVLGLPPTWYKSPAYRARAVAEPRAVLREFGVELAPDTKIRVWDSTSEVRYLVVPERPEGTERMSEDDLAALVTRQHDRRRAGADPGGVTTDPVVADPERLLRPEVERRAGLLRAVGEPRVRSRGRAPRRRGRRLRGFRARLIAEIGAWEAARGAVGEGYRYYERWLVALERTLLEHGLVGEAQLDAARETVEHAGRTTTPATATTTTDVTRRRRALGVALLAVAVVVAAAIVLFTRQDDQSGDLAAALERVVDAGAPGALVVVQGDDVGA